MYHEVTYKERARQRSRRVMVAAAVALAAALAWAGVRMSEELSREQAAASLRESVLRAALQCCAVEGSYPTSVAHLKERYGLVINDIDYQVNYEWMGDNVPPAVVVRPL